ncbi:MAG: Gfo/Idh/MocA family oxidoreductase [Planctomycetia bacterium]|jgi:predicted dehydrogenase
MAQLRIAVVGAGRLGGFHAQKAAANPQLDLVGIVDPSAAARDRVASQCDTKGYADYRTLLDEIDAAVVAAPTSLHFPIVHDLLDAGKHVLCEKPLCPTTDESSRLVDTAAMRNVVLQVGHVERFNPAFEAVRSSTTDAKYIEAVRSSGFTFRSTDVGVVLDLMIHDIDLVLAMVDSPVRSVEALGVSVMGGHEDVANARLHFESGTVVTLSASRVSPTAARTMKVWSACGYTEIDFGALSAKVIEPSDALRNRTFDVESLSPGQVDHYREHLFDECLPCREVQCERIDALEAQQADFLAAITSGGSPRVTGVAGRDAVAVAEMVLESIGSHAWTGQVDGPVGPMAEPRPQILSTPKWHAQPAQQKEAG